MSERDKLGSQYPMTEMDDDRKTKDKILLTSIRMFAERGYDGTSIKDITSKLGITPSTLYNHYKSKDALWDAILDHITQLYMMYFQRLRQAMEEVDSMEAMLDAMFIELLDVVQINMFYGYSLVMAEKIRDARAGGIYCNIFLTYSIDFIKKEFDRAVENGWAQPFDTEITATLFMHSVLHGTDIHVQQDMGRKVPCDVSEMYRGIKAHILKTSQG